MKKENKNNQPSGVDAKPLSYTFTEDKTPIPKPEVSSEEWNKYYTDLHKLQRSIKFFEGQIKKLGEEFTVPELELMAQGLGLMYGFDEQDRAQALKLKLYVLIGEKSK